MKQDKKIQKLLSKLISEEVIAYHLYVGSIFAAKNKIAAQYAKLFEDIAVDERDDHQKKLEKWAIENDYDVVFKFSDYEKYASEETSKLLSSLKYDQKAEYYIKQALKSEEDAIKSYETAIEEKDVPYELQAILYQILYDEYEHYDKLQTLSYAIDAGAQLNEY